MKRQGLLERAGQQERHVIEHMYPLFIHDQWAYSDTLPNEHGIIGSARAASGAPARSLAEQSDMIRDYWTHPETHHPFLIRVNANPAGFFLVQSGSAAPEGCDFYFDEFFLLHRYRRQGTGKHVASEVCGPQPGLWCVDMKALNQPAYQFWSRVAAEVAAGKTQEEQFAWEFGQVIRIRFQVRHLAGPNSPLMNCFRSWSTKFIS